ncbi:transporter substrate-binding domain-containing protein [Desulfonema magnum]|uniref:Solute-binding protein family 3/N-terminal domain-containing protein n=1 Tax=Desulfonema magnum TaxID=45655 RepID=A0A975GNT7_9BACT|nr:transporter substrate-binding domain-containing protein [Desulfonema magnum]QTA87208.1 Uncharacterized protein dnm_032380 [Desulfonema magnum]
MKKVAWFILILVLSASVHPIMAAPGRSEKRAFIVGVDNTEYYPMYGYKNGEYTGYARELLDTFGEDSGYSFQYKSLPILRLYKDFLVSQTVDFKYPDNILWKAELKKGKNIRYSSAVVDYIDGVMVLPENKGKGINEFKRLGTVLGFTPWEYLDHIKSGKIKEDHARTYEIMIRKTLRKRVDGAYSCVSVLNYQLEKLHQPGALVFDPCLPHTKSSYLFSSVKYPQIIERFSVWLMKRKAFVDQLKSKYKLESNLN